MMYLGTLLTAVLLFLAACDGGGGKFSSTTGPTSVVLNCAEPSSNSVTHNTTIDARCDKSDNSVVTPPGQETK